MYKTVSLLLTLSVAAVAFNFLKTLFGPGVSFGMVHYPGWMSATGMIPALLSGVLVLWLLYIQSAASFWVYLTMTILKSGGIFTLIMSLQQQDALASRSPAAAIANASVAVVFMVSLVILWMLWKLTKRGDLTFQNMPLFK